MVCLDDATQSRHYPTRQKLLKKWMFPFKVNQNIDTLAFSIA